MTATGHARASGGVWELSGEVTELLAQAEDGGEVTVVGNGRRPCAQRSARAAWAWHRRGSSLRPIDLIVHGMVQRSEETWLDTLGTEEHRWWHGLYMGVAR